MAVGIECDAAQTRENAIDCDKSARCRKAGGDDRALCENGRPAANNKFGLSRAANGQPARIAPDDAVAVGHHRAG